LALEPESQELAIKDLSSDESVEVVV